MSQKVPQRQCEYQQQSFEYQPTGYPQMQIQGVNLNSKNQIDDQFNKNNFSQPSQVMQKDFNSSLMKKSANNNNNIVSSCLSSVNGINAGTTVSNNHLYDQVQYTHSHGDHSSQNGYFASIQGLQAVATVSDDQNVVVNNQSYCNNPHSFFQNNESIYSANSKSLEASNYHYRNSHANDHNRVELKHAQQLERQDYTQSFIPITYNYQPCFDEQIQQQGISQQQQFQDVKVCDEQKFHSKNYDSILENLGRKIENIAKIAKESEKHDIEIKKYISNENSIDYMLTSPSNNTKKQSKCNNNQQTFNNSDNKDYQDMLLQDTDNKNNLLTNRSNSNLNQLTNRTHAQSITTLYNLNNNHLSSYHARHNSSSSLPLTERDRTFAQQQQFDLPSQRSFTFNDKSNKIQAQSQGLDLIFNGSSNEEGSISSRQHYKEYPSNIQINSKNAFSLKNNLNISKKETDIEKVSKKLETLLKGEEGDSDYVFYNSSVYSQCPHIYSQAKYVILTQSEFEQIMQNKVSEKEVIVSQQQKIQQLEEAIADLNKKQQVLLDHQKEISSKNNQLQENNATLLRTLGNISTEKASQQLRDGFKLQNYTNSINSGQNSINNNAQKQSPESSKTYYKESKLSSISYHASNQHPSQDQEKKQVKLSTVGDKENQQKHNNSSNDYNKSMNYSQTTTQLQTPNTKLINGASKQVGGNLVTTQTKKQSGMGESQYFSKESSNTFNTEQFTSCDIEENKSTEPAHPDSMCMLRQKTEDDDQISTNNNLSNIRISGSLTNIPNQKNFQQYNLNNNSISYHISQNQQLSNQSSVSNLHNQQISQIDSCSHIAQNQIQTYFNQNQMIQSQSGNSILVKNKPPMQPKQKGTVVIRDFLQQDNVSNQQNFNNSSYNKVSENQKKDLQRINSCDIETDNKNSSHISTSSVERTSIDQKKLSATKLLKSKIMMNQQNSHEQIQKQLQEKQHILVEQLQNLTRNDDIVQTVSTKLNSQNIQQINSNQSQTPNSSVISSLSNGLSANNNHILKIQPSFLKNKAQLHQNNPNQSQIQSSSNQLNCHPCHSKSIDSYQMQTNKKQQEQTITSNQSSFTQGLRASVLAGKTNISMQQQPLGQKNDNSSVKDQQDNKNQKKESTQNQSKSGIKSIKNQENVKKSNLTQMNYHLIGPATTGQNQNNQNASVTYCQSNGSSQQSMSIEEFSSTSSRCKKGLSSFYIGGGCNSTNEQSQIPTQKIQKLNSGTNNNGVSGALMTSFSQQIHDNSSQKGSFMNSESFIPTTNKTILNQNDAAQQQPSQSSHSSVNESNRQLKPQLQSQTQKMGQTALILKQITKNQPRQVNLIQNPNQIQTNGQTALNNNYINNFENQQNKSEINQNTKTNINKIPSHSLDKTSKNTTEIQNNPLYNFKIPFNHQINKDILGSNLRANPHLGQTQVVSNNQEKRKSGSLTQRGDNDKPFDLKDHILQNQRERSEKSIPSYIQKQNNNIMDNEKKTLEKRTKHTNSVPQFSSQSIVHKPDSSKELQQNQGQDIRINKDFSDSKFTQIRPSSVNSGLIRHFTSLNDQLEIQDKPHTINQNQQDDKQQIMTERIERNTIKNYKDVNPYINQTQGRIRSLPKQGNTSAQIGDRNNNGEQDCNIF